MPKAPHRHFIISENNLGKERKKRNVLKTSFENVK